MSTYVTVAESADRASSWWAISVDAVDSGSPIRIDHGSHSWYLPTEVVDKIQDALRAERRSRPRPPRPVVATFMRHGSRNTETFESFENAAIAAAVACDDNFAAYLGAKNLDTGETWTRQELLDAGCAILEGGDNE